MRTTVVDRPPSLHSLLELYGSAESLRSWLAAPAERLVLPRAFTQGWFEENARHVHPSQLRTLIDELVSRGWSREDIERRASPHLERAAVERATILEWDDRIKRERAERAERAVREERERESSAARLRRDREHQKIDRWAARAARWRALRRAVGVPKRPPV